MVLYHEELAEGDVWEDVVSLVLATDLLGLLPELGELLGQGPRGPQVQDVLPGQGVVQERVTHMGEEPGRHKEMVNWCRNALCPPSGALGTSVIRRLWREFYQG